MLSMEGTRVSPQLGKELLFMQHYRLTGLITDYEVHGLVGSMVSNMATMKML